MLAIVRATARVASSGIVWLSVRPARRHSQTSDELVGITTSQGRSVVDLRDGPATMDEDAAGMVEPGLHLDPSVSALDRHASWAVGGQGDRQCGELVLREGQQHGGIGVDAIREVLATSDDLGGFTEEPDGEIEGVDTEVEGHSAT